MRHGELYWCNFISKDSNCVEGIKPCIIITSNAIKNSPVITVIPCTTKLKNTRQLTHVIINNYSDCGLNEPSLAMIEQLQTVQKTQILGKIGYWDKDTKQKVKKKLQVAFGLA